MKRLVLFLVLVCAFVTALLLTASPAEAHCVQTPTGFADLAPGHFAAAGGHEAAIAHSEAFWGHRVAATSRTQRHGTTTPRRTGSHTKSHPHPVRGGSNPSLTCSRVATRARLRALRRSGGTLAAWTGDVNVGRF